MKSCWAWAIFYFGGKMFLHLLYLHNSPTTAFADKNLEILFPQSYYTHIHVIGTIVQTTACMETTVGQPATKAFQ